MPKTRAFRCLVPIPSQRETDEEARLRGLLEREVQVPHADQSTCRRYYESNRQEIDRAIQENEEGEDGLVE